MTAKSHKRLISRLLLAVVAAVAAVALLVAVGASAPVASAIPAGSGAHHLSTHKILAFHRAMDKLWEDHVTWTRLAIVSFSADLPDLSATESRLLQNQVDIGNAIKPFYGAAAGDELTALLRTHILEAVAVLQAVKAGDATQLAAAQKAWYENAHQIAAFLASANPKSWTLPEMTRMMDEHLKLTTQEAVARLQGDYPADVAAYDQVHNEILKMSEMLANGIIRQFPQRFR